MAAERTAKLKSRDAIKTYRYLRIGMIGAVVLLAASIAIERGKVHCWQTSISAYYYTPVRAIFVGGMIAVGLSLIVIKGRGLWEDNCLNLAGILAPVVAVAPTTDVGRCWSVQPNPLPINADGSLTHWVVTNIDNNFNALLVAGVIGLTAAVVIVILEKRGMLGSAEEVEPGTIPSLLVTASGLMIGWWLFLNWHNFNTRAHGFAALFMFVALIGAVGGKAREHQAGQTTAYFRLYAAVAAVMVIGGVVIAALRIGGAHTVLVLEAFEILLFAVFWLVQTVENWNEEVADPPTTETALAAAEDR
jgi:hypothetical protein